MRRSPHKKILFYSLISCALRRTFGHGFGHTEMALALEAVDDNSAFRWNLDTIRNAKRRCASKAR
jgi:hypothetical protein